METALYYTLSTIAQTLAGALAILVAVVLFRLGALGGSIERAKATLRAYSVEPTKYWPVLRDHGYEVMADQVLSQTNSEQHQNQDLRRDCDAAVAAYKDWGRINRRLYTVLGFTVVNIAACLAALPYTPSLVGCGCATHVIWTTVGLSIICLLLYVWLITAMVRRPTD